MRLTKRHELKGLIGYTYGDNNLNGYTTIGEPITKLGQLEDIEEELGIDLITLFKALKEGFYGTSYGTSKEEKHFVSYYELSDIDIKKYDGKIAFIYYLGNMSYSDFIVYKLEDYGNTWALTREELEK